jgi:hypothetical protein
MFGILLALSLSLGSAQASTEYLLIQQDTSIGSTDSGMTIGKPAASMSLSNTNAGCGYKPDGMGGYGSDSNYQSTAYGSWMIIADSGDTKGARIPSKAYVIGENVSPANKLTSFSNLRSGATCTETIDSTSVVFKKYSVTCDGCSN